MNEVVVCARGVSKEYRLGQIGSGTLRRDMQSWWAKKRGREDPNRKLNARALTGDRFLAVDDVSFDVRRGDAVGLVGHNGAGKSTLLKLIARITAPTEGEIGVRGRIASMLEVGTGFHPELTGRENVFLNGAILGMSRREVAAKLDEIIEFSEIAPFIDTPVKRYSSGMYVKLAFSVAAHMEPEILICDEVLAVGDQKFQQKCLGKMRDVAGGGRTVIYVSHNMRTIEQLCSRGICLERGRVACDGGVREAVERYAGASAERGLEHDLDALPRSRSAGGFARMTRLRVLGSADCQYPLDGEMRLSLDWTAREALEDVRLRAIAVSPSGQPVAMGATAAAFANPRAGEKLNHTVTVPLRALAPGEYRATLILYRSNGVGQSLNLDIVEDALRFEVLDDAEKTGGLQWQSRWWGGAHLNDLTVEGGQSE